MATDLKPQPPRKRADEQPERLDLRSMDVTAEKKQELLRLFPEVRTEDGMIDFDRLRLALGETVDTGRERYGMTWSGKAECFRTIQTPSLGTLLPSRDESVEFDTTQNLIIEGDNLEVLKLMQKSYLGKVKMIYIDPPYNTGNDFIYPDDYTESMQTYLAYTGQVDAEGKRFSTNTEADGRFHSKWMNMMYPRLYLARNLLREDGFLIASIDDAELSNLRRLLNEVFGEESFVTVLVFDRNRKNDAKLFSVGHEYMLVFARNLSHLRDEGTELRTPKAGVEDVREEFERLRRAYNDDWARVRDSLRDYYRTWEADDPRQPLARYTHVDARGPYRDDGNINWPGGGGPMYDVIHPRTGKPCKKPASGWRYPNLERMQEEIQAGRVIFGEDETTVPRVRMNLFESQKQVMGSVHYSYAQTAANEFNALFDGKRVFDNPKNYADLERLIQYLTGPNDLVMDFFAGSGSTGHAVLTLNQLAGSSRSFVLVQLPEPTGRDDYKQIAEITKERLRRVINKLNDEDAEKFNFGAGTKQDRGFRVFKLAESNFKTWDADAPKEPKALTEQLELHVQHIRPGREQEDLLFEILMKSGYPLTARVETLTLEGKKVFSVAEGALLVCLEKDLTPDVIRAIAARKPERVVCLDEGFAGNDQLKANAVQIFKTLHRRGDEGEKSSDVTVFRTV